MKLLRPRLSRSQYMGMQTLGRRRPVVRGDKPCAGPARPAHAMFCDDCRAQLPPTHNLWAGACELHQIGLATMPENEIAGCITQLYG